LLQIRTDANIQSKLNVASTVAAVNACMCHRISHIFGHCYALGRYVQ